MDPWEIIGWCIVVGGVIYVGSFVLMFLFALLIGPKRGD